MADWQRSIPRDQLWGGCRLCIHDRRDGTCIAFPAGIPIVIASGDVDHLVVRPGQIGDTVFEPVTVYRFRVPSRPPGAQLPDNDARHSNRRTVISSGASRPSGGERVTRTRPAGPVSRRRVLALSATLGGLVVLPSVLRPPPLATAQPGRRTPAEALQRLVEGNRRFAGGAPLQADISVARRAELAAGQQPFAAVVSCADSRVPPEIIFDQGLGDLFVCRIAGNFVDAGIAGSIEYAVGVLGVSLVLVLGHGACGALKETVNALKGGGPISPNLDLLVNALTVPVLRVLDQPGDLLDNAIRSNVRFGVERLTAEPEIAPFIRNGTVRVIGGEYRLDSGLVELLS